MIQGKLVLNDGREIDIELLEENLKSIETYLRSGRVSSALLKNKNANSAVAGELMYDDVGMITIKMDDNSIVPIKTAEYNIISMYIENNLEVRDLEIKPETDGKHFYQTGSMLKMKQKLDTNTEKTNVLTVYQRDSLGKLEPHVVVPYMDVDHVVVPTYIGPTANDWEFPLLRQWMDNITSWLERLELNIGDFLNTVEMKQLDTNIVNGIVPTTPGTDLKFKMGISLWLVDSTNAAWSAIIKNLCPVSKGTTRALVKNIRYHNTSYQEIIPQVYNEATSNYTFINANSGYKKAYRYWKLDTLTWSTPVLINDTALDERNVLWGDNKLGKSIGVTKMVDIFQTGTYFFNGSDGNTPMLRSGARSTSGVVIASCTQWNRSDNLSLDGIPLGSAHIRSIYIDVGTNEIYYSSPYVVNRASSGSMSISSLVWYKMAGHTVDNLTSTSPTDVLSANQGRILDEKKLDKGVLQPGINNAGDIMNVVNSKADTTIFNQHTSDNSIHITTIERNYWNSALQKTDVINNLTSTSTEFPLAANQGRVLKTTLDGHTGNTTIHITSGERTLWNAALQRSNVLNNLTSTNTDLPLSANMGKKLNEDKVNWSAVENNMTSWSGTNPLAANIGRHLNAVKWSNGSANLTLNGYVVTIV